MILKLGTIIFSTLLPQKPMLKKPLLIAVFYFGCQHLFAQKTIPALKANTNVVSIKEGNFLYKDIWNVSPEAKPDVFGTNPFSNQQTITFYSGEDSLTFLVKPNKKYDFVIVVNGKDSAFTRINTAVKSVPSLVPKLVYSTNAIHSGSGTDTLHFTLGKDNGIHVKGRVNQSDTLDFLFDTGAGINVITASLVNTKVKLKFDGTQANTGSDGTKNVRSSSKNTMTTGNLTWSNVPLLAIDYKGFPFDMVLSWVSFENKIVEIDYDHKLILLHEKLPLLSPQYSRLSMKMVDGIPFIKCSMLVDEKEVEGWFDFDTGSDGNMIIGEKYAAENNLQHSMESKGQSTSTGSSGVAFKQQVVLLPALKLGKYFLYNIPVSINEKDPAGVANNENIGSNLLKRFNAVIDFNNNAIYIKPNSLFYSAL